MPLLRREGGNSSSSSSSNDALVLSTGRRVTCCLSNQVTSAALERPEPEPLHVCTGQVKSSCMDAVLACIDSDGSALFAEIYPRLATAFVERLPSREGADLFDMPGTCRFSFAWPCPLVVGRLLSWYVIRCSFSIMRPPQLSRSVG